MKAEDIIEALAIAEYGNRETWPIMPEGGRDIFRQDAREVRNRLSEAGFIVLPKEELEAALKPFADEANSEGNIRLSLGADIDHWPIGANSLTLGDLRRAAALLAAITQEGRG